VATGAARNGAAIVRPPGHHAESGMAMGFCFYNNAAIAAKAARAAGAPRVLILDWVHTSAYLTTLSCNLGSYLRPSRGDNLLCAAGSFNTASSTCLFLKKLPSRLSDCVHGLTQCRLHSAFVLTPDLYHFTCVVGCAPRQWHSAHSGRRPLHHVHVAAPLRRVRLFTLSPCRFCFANPQTIERRAIVIRI